MWAFETIPKEILDQAFQLEDCVKTYNSSAEVETIFEGSTGLVSDNPPNRKEDDIPDSVYDEQHDHQDEIPNASAEEGTPPDESDIKEEKKPISPRTRRTRRG